MVAVVGVVVDGGCCGNCGGVEVMVVVYECWMLRNILGALQGRIAKQQFKIAGVPHGSPLSAQGQLCVQAAGRLQRRR